MCDKGPRAQGILGQTSKVRATLKNLVIFFVLMAATMHCVQTIFTDNASLLDLQKYEDGQEKMPFQGRVAMMPVLRWGHARYGGAVAALSPGVNFGYDPYTPEKIVSYRVGLYSLAIIVLLCMRYGVRNGREFWWLCPALAILTFYVSYGARGDQHYWYPYDLPHAALFTAACLFLLEGKWFLMAAFFLADLPTRETSIYLIPCLLAVGWVQRQRLRAVAFSAVMAAAWLAVHLTIARHFRANPSDTGVHLKHFGWMIRYPHFWPQTMTAFGYMWLPMVFLWRYLQRKQRAFIAGAVPGLLTTAAFGIWYESRVWSEWNAVAACLVFSAATRYFRQSRYSYREGSPVGGLARVPVPDVGTLAQRERHRSA